MPYFDEDARREAKLEGDRRRHREFREREKERKEHLQDELVMLRERQRQAALQDEEPTPEEWEYWNAVLRGYDEAHPGVHWQDKNHRYLAALQWQIEQQGPDSPLRGLLR